MKELMNGVRHLVKEEKGRAVEKYGTFKNDAEYWGALDEEVMEVKDDMRAVENALEEVKISIHDGDDVCTDHFTKKLSDYAVHLACEAIQVAAVCEKYLD